MMNRKTWVIGIGIVTLALGLAACSTPSVKSNSNKPTSSPSASSTATATLSSSSNARDLATKFALYVVDEKLLTPSREGLPYSGKIIDAGVKATTVSWTLMPEKNGTLLCTIATPTDSVASAQVAFVSLFEFSSAQSLSKGRYSFADSGATTCTEAKTKLITYQIGSKTTVLDFFPLKDKDPQALSPYTLTNKGLASNTAYTQSGNFLVRQAKVDDKLIAQFNTLLPFLTSAMKSKALTGSQTDGSQKSLSKLTNSKTGKTYTIPLGTYLHYNVQAGSYCADLNGWKLDSKRGMPTRGFCDGSLIQQALLGDAKKIEAGVNALLAGKTSYAGQSIHLDANGKLTVVSPKIGKVTSTSTVLHSATYAVVDGEIGTAKNWCLELNNNGLFLPVTQNIPLIGASECPPLSSLMPSKVPPAK